MPEPMPRWINHFIFGTRDEISPDFLSEVLPELIAALERGAEEAEVAVNWETFEFTTAPAVTRSGDDGYIGLRVRVRTFDE